MVAFSARLIPVWYYVYVLKEATWLANHEKFA